MAVLGCGSDSAPPLVRNLDRPSEMAFACWGEVRLADGTIDQAAQPMAACEARVRGEVPPGQEEVAAPEVRGFVLESARGTVAMVSTVVTAVLDGDPLTPGTNPLPLATLPVGLAADATGCFMVSASAASCDLDALEVDSAIELSEEARVVRVPVTAGGERLLARPGALAAFGQTGAIGEACPETPTGIVYVAYPSCHLVAAIDAATGEVRAGVSFGDGGAISITDGAVSCPAECGDASLDVMAHGGEPDAGPSMVDGVGRPTALTMGGDGKLYVAADNQARLVAVTLDEGGLPTATASVDLEGEIGVERIAISEEIGVGGDTGAVGDVIAGDGGVTRYAYAIATDRTIRVVDLVQGIECDTQVDPRGLAGVTDVARLSCLPVGAPETPARRPSARSPGIQLPRDTVPFDVAFATVTPEVEPLTESPFDLDGTFAFITSSDGLVYLVNVDDDSYPDFEIAEDPGRVYLPLALAHQLRDFGRDRAELASSCSLPADEAVILGPRLASQPELTVSDQRIAPEKIDLLPSLRNVACSDDDGDVPVPELDFAAPPDVREGAYPDLASVRNETWYLAWEGGVSIDGPNADVDGPVIRRGTFSFEGGLYLDDPAAPFCDAGVEPFDILALGGCDPTLGASQCGVGETCYVHPDSPAVVTNGQCLPSGQIDLLSNRCEEFLTTLRRYSVTQTFGRQLKLTPRRRVLRTSPLDGCTSDAQCGELEVAEAALADGRHPSEIPTGEPAHAWTCGPDPSRAAGPDRCMMACADDADCDPGTACTVDGVCVEGVVPPSECVAAVQRYQLRVGDAFALVGDRTGFLHDRVLDEATGACVSDPAASPLLVGRVPLRPAPCVDGDPTINPCLTTVTQADKRTPFSFEGGECRGGTSELVVRDAPAIRVRNPALTFNLVDPETVGDAECRGDRAGTGGPFAAVFAGFQIALTMTGGYFPMFVANLEAAHPGTVARSPDGRLWVVDSGDANSITNGRIFVLDPRAALDNFSLLSIL
jgi:hypothetical protein